MTPEVIDLLSSSPSTSRNLSTESNRHDLQLLVSRLRPHKVSRKEVSQPAPELNYGSRLHHDPKHAPPAGGTFDSIFNLTDEIDHDDLLSPLQKRCRDPIEITNSPGPHNSQPTNSDGLDVSVGFPDALYRPQTSGCSMRDKDLLRRRGVSTHINPDECRINRRKNSVADDFDDIFVSSSPRQEEAPLKRQKTWDPIQSSQSDVVQQTMRKDVHRVVDVIDIDSDPEYHSDSSGLPELRDIPASKPVFSRDVQAQPKSTAPSQPGKPPKGSTDHKARSSQRQACEGQARKTTEVKAAEREQKRRERQAEKAQKAREKERAAALAEVNKVKTDKKVSTPEMIIDLPSTLDPTTTLQAQALLRDLSVQDALWNSPIDNVIKWKRKITSRYDEQEERWEPTPLRIEKEKYALVIIHAEQFVQLCTSVHGLQSHVAGVKLHFGDCIIIYLCEGLGPWMRRNRTFRNRQFSSAVRGGDARGTGPPAGRRKNQHQEYVEERLVEDSLLELQVIHRVLIHHTNLPLETAQWIATFTQHISTVPYRKQREEANASAAAFCMDFGQVRSGNDTKDTYVRMLEEISRVTAPIAYGIATEFGTVSQLVRGLQRGGPLALDDCRKSANKYGDLSERRIGASISKRLHSVFTGKNPTSTDV